MDNETIGRIIDRKELNNHIDEDAITPSDYNYDEYRWGRPKAEFTKKSAAAPKPCQLILGNMINFILMATIMTYQPIMLIN